MMSLGPLALLALLFGLAAAQLGWPTHSVTHKFMDTENGQLHYVTNGPLDTETPPLVYLHAHPRSSTEIKLVYAEMIHDTPFVAVDMFGMGFSEAYEGNKLQPRSDDHVTFEKYAEYVLKILEKEGVKQFVPAGNEKGAHAAIELGAQGGPERVKKIVLMAPLILSPANKEFVVNILIPKEKNPTIFANGSHVLDAWKDPSATDPVYPRDLKVNQEKTIDAMSSMFTNWEFQAGWTGYNEKQVDRLKYIDTFAESLIIHPLLAYAEWKSWGLDPDYSLNKLDEIFTHGRNSTKFIVANSGLLSQNASFVANLVEEFMHSTHAAINV